MKRRTVRCSYCHGKGHNRTTCPVLVAHAKEDPNSYAALYMKRKKEQKKASIRRCSYCREMGHTKRTCPTRQEDMRKIDINNVLFRHKILESMTRQGVGIGALLRVANGSVSHGVQKGDLLLVSRISWDDLNIDNCSWSYRSESDTMSYSLVNKIQPHLYSYQRHMRCFVQRTGEYVNLFLPQQYDRTTELLNYSSRDDLEVVSASKPNQPSDWTSHKEWAHKVMI